MCLSPCQLGRATRRLVIARALGHGPGDHATRRVYRDVMHDCRRQQTPSSEHDPQLAGIAYVDPHRRLLICANIGSRGTAISTATLDTPTAHITGFPRSCFSDHDIPCAEGGGGRTMNARAFASPFRARVVRCTAALSGHGGHGRDWVPLLGFTHGLLGPHLCRPSPTTNAGRSTRRD